MRRVIGLGFALGLTLVVMGGAAVPAASAARSSTPDPREPCPVAHPILNVAYSCALQFSLRGSNGYRITVSGDPGGHGPADVEINIDNPTGGVFYLGHGTVSPRGMHATFGRVGKISVRFHPSGKERRVRVSKACLKNRPPTVTAQLGTFVGTVRLHGENGYTSVVAHRAIGGLGDPLAISRGKLQCGWYPSTAERKEEEESVQLTAADKSSGVYFSASPLFRGSPQPGGATGRPTSGKGKDLFLAIQGERREGLLVIRTAGAAAPSSAFSFDPALTSATVTPPPPFTGAATFERNADGSTSWTGSLGVSMPGLGLVSLTGPGYKSELATVAQQLRQLEEEPSGSSKPR